MELIRKAGNSGKFYPSSAKQIEEMFRRWNLIVRENGLEFPDVVPEAIVCPHAGYVYSGFTANVAHRILPRKKPRHVLVIGPSHHVYIDGMSLGGFDAFETPFGLLHGDKEAASFLMEHFDFQFSSYAHQVEHSTETQFPFLKYYNPDVKILELIYGQTEPAILKEVMELYLQITGSAIVVSTDLSHYYPQTEANRLDAYCLEAVKYKDLYMLNKGCEACGKPGLQAIIQAAIDFDWKAEVLDYRTSGDVTGDFSAVVGYMSVAFYK